MIHELRIYECAPGKMPELHDRFTKHTMTFFEKYGIKVIGFWTEEIGANNRLVYITEFESLADREIRWKAFATDPDWIKARISTEVDGPLTVRVVNTILRPTDYSPLQ